MCASEIDGGSAASPVAARLGEGAKDVPRMPTNPGKVTAKTKGALASVPTTPGRKKTAKASLAREPTTPASLARAPTSGFACVGKLAGAKRRLFKAAVATLHEKNSDPMQLMSVDDEYPFCGERLSPQHRVHILRELAEGLLCAHTPLPPDTPIHASAFLHVLSVACAEIECEIDCAAEDEMEERGESRYAPMSEAEKVAMRAELAAHVETLEAAGVQSQQEAQQENRLQRNTEKVLDGVLSDGALLDTMVAAEGAGDSDSIQDHIDIARALRVSSQTKNPRGIARCNPARLREKPEDYFWRRLVYAVAVEAVNPIGGGTPIIQIYRQLLPRGTPFDASCSDSQDWSYLIFQLLPMEWWKSASSDTDPLLRFGALQGALDDGESTPARVAIVRRITREAERKFAKGWRPRVTATDERVIAVLSSDKVDAPHTSLPYLYADSNHNATGCKDSEIYQRTMATFWPPAIVAVDEAFGPADNFLDKVLREYGAAHRDDGPSGGRSPLEEAEAKLHRFLDTKDCDAQRMVEMMLPMAWAVPYFEEMAKIPGDFRDPDKRLAAVLAAAERANAQFPRIWNAAFRWPGQNLVDPKKPPRKYAKEQRSTSKDGNVCSSCGKDPPPNSTLKLCEVCRVARYCNHTCQRAAWKSGHKQECLAFKREVEARAAAAGGSGGL